MCHSLTPHPRFVIVTLPMSAKRLTPENEAPASTAVFFLFDTLFRELASEQERAPLEAQERFNTLKLALETQLLAFVREELHLPVASEVHNVDLNQWLQGKLKIYHPRYSHFDLLEVAQNSLDFHEGTRQQRYQREAAQVKKLYEEKLAPDLENIENWVSLSAQDLPFVVRQSLHISPEEEVFVGHKYGLLRPANLEVYPDGYSYINLYQLLYIPRTKKVHLIEDFLYDELSAEDHQFLAEDWDPTVETSENPTEKSLMDLCITLPEELRLLPGFSLFERALNTLQSEPGDALNISLREKQQTRLGKLSSQEETLQTASTFLTQILITEYALCQEDSSLLNGLAQRLQVAFEMVAHPIVSGVEFQYKPSLDAYQNHVLPNISKFRRLLKIPVRRRQSELYQEMNVRRQELRGKNADKTIKSRRSIALNALSKDYPAILGRVSSVAQCSVGSFGGISEVFQQANSSLGQSVLQGHLLDKASLSQLIGEKRAQEWKMGQCINPRCKNGRKEQLVGECSLCFRCEMESNLGELENITKEEFKDVSHNKLQRLLNGQAGDVSNLVGEMTSIPINLFIPYMITNSVMPEATR